MYLVTVEDQDGMWFNDPHGFETEDQARRYMAEAVSPPNGYACVLYRCYEMPEKK